MKPISVTLSVLLTQGREWCARSLEHDIAGQGETMDAALESLRLCVIAHILSDVNRGEEPLRGVPSAPRDVWERFNVAHVLEGERVLRAPSRSEIPPAIAARLPEPWMLPEARVRELRVC